MLLLSQHSFVVPDFILDELRNHLGVIAQKTTLSGHEIQSILDDLINLSNIEIVPLKDYKEYISKAQKISPDPDDVPYFAVALKRKCSLWSNDKKLKKQGAVKVYNSQEIMALT